MEEMGKVFVLFGAPGSGKGTQGEFLEKQFGLPRVSTGDLFRALPEHGVGAEIKVLMKQGALVPDEKVTEMLRDELSNEKYANGFLLDGYPRTIPQAEALEKLLSSLGHTLENVIYLKVPTHELKRRLGGRWTCRACKKIYSSDEGKPAATCGLCGGEIYQRTDDAPAGVKTRLKTFSKQTKPLEGYYKKKKLLQTVRVPKNAQKEEVFELVMKAVRGEKQPGPIARANAWMKRRARRDSNPRPTD